MVASSSGLKVVKVEPPEVEDVAEYLHLKTVKRGKVKAHCDAPFDLLDPPRRSCRNLAVSSRFGFVFQISGQNVGVTKWLNAAKTGFEDCCTEIEGIELKKASLAKVKDSILAPDVFAVFTPGTGTDSNSSNILTGVLLSPDELQLVAWSDRKVFLYDLRTLRKGKENRCTWSTELPSPVVDISFHRDGDVLLLMSGSILMLTSDTGKCIREINLTLEGEIKCLCMSICPDNMLSVAVGCSDGNILLVSWENNTFVTKMRIESSLEIVEEQPFEAHSILWFDLKTVFVGFRRPFVPPPRKESEKDEFDYEIFVPPMLGVFEIDDALSACVNSCIFVDPLDFGALDRRWEHCFFLSKVPYLNAIAVLSSWSPRMALIVSNPNSPSFSWKRAKINDYMNEETPSPRVCADSMWNLAENPWNWIKDGEPDDPEDEFNRQICLIGVALSWCSQSPIVPYQIFGDTVELSTKPHFLPPPTLLLLTSDGVIETIALADQEYPVGASIGKIPGMVAAFDELPKWEEAPISSDWSIAAPNPPVGFLNNVFSSNQSVEMTVNRSEQLKSRTDRGMPVLSPEIEAINDKISADIKEPVRSPPGSPYSLGLGSKTLDSPFCAIEVVQTDRASETLKLPPIFSKPGEESTPASLNPPKIRSESTNGTRPSKVTSEEQDRNVVIERVMRLSKDVETTVHRLQAENTQLKEELDRFKRWEALKSCPTFDSISLRSTPDTAEDRITSPSTSCQLVLKEPSEDIEDEVTLLVKSIMVMFDLRSEALDKAYFQKDDLKSLNDADLEFEQQALRIKKFCDDLLCYGEENILTAIKKAGKAVHGFRRNYLNQESNFHLIARRVKRASALRKTLDDDAFCDDDPLVAQRCQNIMQDLRDRFVDVRNRLEFVDEQIEAHEQYVRQLKKYVRVNSLRDSATRQSIPMACRSDRHALSIALSNYKVSRSLLLSLSDMAGALRGLQSMYEAEEEVKVESDESSQQVAIVDLADTRNVNVSLHSETTEKFTRTNISDDINRIDHIDRRLSLLRKSSAKVPVRDKNGVIIRHDSNAMVSSFRKTTLGKELQQRRAWIAEMVKSAQAPQELDSAALDFLASFSSPQRSQMTIKSGQMNIANPKIAPVVASTIGKSWEEVGSKVNGTENNSAFASKSSNPVFSEKSDSKISMSSPDFAADTTSSKTDKGTDFGVLTNPKDGLKMKVAEADKIESEKSTGSNFGLSVDTCGKASDSKAFEQPKTVRFDLSESKSLDGTSMLSSATCTDYSNIDVVASMRKFYEKHNPSQIDKVESLANKYQGRPQDMFRRMQEKYGTPVPLIAKVAAGEVGSSLSDSGMKADTGSGVKSLSATFSSQGLAEGNIAPTQPNVSGGLGSFSGSGFGLSGFGGTASMSSFGGASASAQAASPFAPSLGSASSAQSGNNSNLLININDSSVVRQKLVEFYTRYNADKLNSIDGLIQKYVGRYADLFRSLEKKYGAGSSGVFKVSGESGNYSAAFGSSGFGAAGAPAASQQYAGGGFGSFANAGSGGFGTTQQPTGSGFATPQQQTGGGFGSTQQQTGSGFGGSGLTSSSFGASPSYGNTGGVFVSPGTASTSNAPSQSTGFGVFGGSGNTAFGGSSPSSFGQAGFGQSSTTATFGDSSKNSYSGSSFTQMRA